MPLYRKRSRKVVGSSRRKRSSRVAMMPNSVSSKGVHWTTQHHSFKGPILLVNKEFAEGSTTILTGTFFRGTRMPQLTYPNVWSESRTGTWMSQGTLTPTNTAIVNSGCPATNGPFYRVFLPNGYFRSTNSIAPVNTTYWGGSFGSTLALTATANTDDRYTTFMGQTYWARALGLTGQGTSDLLEDNNQARPNITSLSRIKGIQTCMMQNSSGNDTVALFLPYVDIFNAKPWDCQWSGPGVFDVAYNGRFQLWDSSFLDWMQQVRGKYNPIEGQSPFGKEFRPIPAAIETKEFIPYVLKFSWTFKFWHAAQHALYNNPRILNMFKRVAVRVLVLEYITPSRKQASEATLAEIGNRATIYDPHEAPTDDIDKINPINPSELKMRFELVDGFKTRGIEHGLQYTSHDLKSRINRKRYKVHSDRTIYLTLDELYKHTGGFTSKKLNFTHVFDRRHPFRFRGGDAQATMGNDEAKTEYQKLLSSNPTGDVTQYYGLINHRIFPYVIPRFPISPSAMCDMMMCRVSDSASTTITAPEARQEVYRQQAYDGTTATTNDFSNTYNPNFEGANGTANQATTNLFSNAKNTYLRKSGATGKPHRCAFPQETQFELFDVGKRAIVTKNNHVSWGTAATSTPQNNAYMLGLVQGFQLSVEDTMALGVTTNIHPKAFKF
jgi:hypothetical protein